jgi:hypothetical protein
MIPIDWTSVESSNVDAVKYDAVASELHVRFKHGGTYVYEDVEPEDAEGLMHASSPGQYLHANIIGSHNYRKT